MANHARISPKTPSFSRIILPHILENGTLELQKDFVKQNWRSLCNNACLEVPTGAKSEMKMKVSNGIAHLHEGWKDFAEKYSIKAGYFLVFTYHGSSNFSVQIFHPSTLEIEYEEASIITGEKAVVQSRNPQFNVTMKPTNNVTSASRRAYYMHIPKIAASYFCNKRTDDIHLSLKGGNGKIWIMKYYPGTAPEYLARIGSGWKDFSEENNLKEGDMCTFEPVSGTEMKFNVTISRKTNEEIVSPGTKRKRDLSVKEKSTALECNETSFTATIRKAQVQGCRLNIPRAHSRHLLDQHGKEVFLHPFGGKVWRVKCNVNGFDVRFIRGWKDFVVGNDLQVGDTCDFELFSRKPNHYNVAIFSGAGSSG